MRRGRQRPEDKGALARDTDGIQHIESVIPQPSPPSRNRIPRERDSEESIADDLRDSPCAHAAEVRVVAQLGLARADNVTAEGRHDPPD